MNNYAMIIFSLSICLSGAVINGADSYVTPGQVQTITTDPSATPVVSETPGQVQTITADPSAAPVASAAPAPATDLKSQYIITIDDINNKLDGSTVTRQLSINVAGYLFDMYTAYRIVNHNQTDNAIKNVIDGSKDLALVTYPSQENFEYASQKGVVLVMIPVVNDAFVFLVNNNNSIDNLSQDQIRRIYSKQEKYWSGLGGTITGWAEYVVREGENHYYTFGQALTSSPPILPFQRNDGSGSQSGMTEFMGDTPITVQYHESTCIQAMDMLVERVNLIPNSIGYSYQYYLNKMFIRNTKVISVDGIAPTDENIENGTYPIITPYYAVFKSDEPADSFARAFTELLLSPEGQQIAKEAGYVGLGAEQLQHGEDSAP